MDLSDIRLFVIHGMARCEGSMAEFDFHTKAKSAICQDIPILNQSKEEWTIKATIQGHFFSCPFSLIAKPGVITNYPVTFNPIKECDVNGILQLTNIQTSQKYTYILKGSASEPDPQDSFTINGTCRSKVFLN